MNNTQKIIVFTLSPYICYAVLIIKLLEPDYSFFIARADNLNLFQHIWYNHGFMLISWIIAGFIIANMIFVYNKIYTSKNIIVLLIIQIVMPFTFAYLLPRKKITIFWYNPDCIKLMALLTGIHIYLIYDTTKKLKNNIKNPDNADV